MILLIKIYKKKYFESIFLIVSEPFGNIILTFSNKSVLVLIELETDELDDTDILDDPELLLMLFRIFIKLSVLLLLLLLAFDNIVSLLFLLLFKNLVAFNL